MVLPLTYFSRPDYCFPPASVEELTFRHSGWAPRRSLTFDALRRVGASQAQQEAFANCGSQLWLERTSTGDDLRMRCNQCHNRWCVPCATARGTIIAEAVGRLISTRCPRFLTLTLRHNDTPLIDQLDRLYRSFSVLRRRASWRQHVEGGASFLEVKLSDRDGRWHPHLHCLIEGTWWAQKEIAAEWQAVTGDSSIVDVRAINRPGDAAGYVSKYVTKPAHGSVFLQPECLDELMVALRGRRLCLTFGTWRGEKLEEVEDDGRKWISCGGVHTLISRAREGDELSVRWCEAAARKWPDCSLFALFVPAGPRPP